MMNVSSVGVIVRWHSSVMLFYYVMRHCFNDELRSDPSVLFADDMGATYTVEAMFCHRSRLRENRRMVLDMWRRVLGRLKCLWMVKLVPLHDWLVMESIVVMLLVDVPDPFTVNMIWTSDLVID